MIRRFTVAISALAVVWGMAAPVQAQSGSIEVYGQVLPTPFTIGVTADYQVPVAQSLTAAGFVDVFYPLGGSFGANAGAGLYYDIPLVSGGNLNVNATLAAELYADLAPTQSFSVAFRPSILGTYALDANTSIYAGAFWTLLGYSDTGLIQPINGRRGIYAGATINAGALSLEPYVGFYFPGGIELEANVTASYAISSAFTVGATLGLDGNISYGTLGPLLRIFGRYSF